MRGNKIRKAKERGITLIALVITIIILIILATIAIRGAVGDNGLVGWAKEARDKTKQGEEDEDKAMSDLDKYIEEQTADSGVIINISKTPETEKTGAVILKVESVEGIEGNIDLNNVDISTLSEEEKKNMVRTIEVFYNNCFNVYGETKVKNFNELVSLYFSTEEEFWNECLSYYDGNIDNYLQNRISEFKQRGIQTINNYTVVNPDGNILDYQMVYVNGTYTFKVVEITTGKEYTKSVQVSNIDNTMQDYYVNQDEYFIYLLDKSTDEPTTFESAYIIYDNQKIDISSCILEDNGYNFIHTTDLEKNFSLPYYKSLVLEIFKKEKKYLGVIIIRESD